MKEEAIWVTLVRVKFFCILSAALWVSSSWTYAQGFLNLGFESANMPAVPPGQFGGNVSSLDAIPGWTAFIGATQLTQIMQNNFTLGNASVDILGPFWNGGGIIEGQFTIVLQPGRGPNGGGIPPNVSASISQTGVVPVGSKSIQFKAIADNFSINLGGQDLPVVALGNGPNYTIYGANIPLADAGQSETLTVTALAGPNTTDNFDSFVFLSTPTPEPSAWALLLCGAGLLSIGHKWRRQ